MGERIIGRLLVQLGEGRAAEASADQSLLSAIGVEHDALVVLRTDITGFREHVKEHPVEASNLLCTAVRAIREITLSNAGMFEKHLGDRTVSVFMGPSSSPEKGNSLQIAWTRALRAALKISEEFERILEIRWPFDTTPLLRIGLAGGGGKNVRVFSSLPTDSLPPEFVTFGYDAEDRSFHALANDFCDFATEETIRNLIHEFEDYFHGTDFAPDSHDSQRARRLVLEFESLTSALVDRRHLHSLILADKEGLVEPYRRETEMELQAEYPDLSFFDISLALKGKVGRLLGVIPCVKNRRRALANGAKLF